MVLTREKDHAGFYMQPPGDGLPHLVVGLQVPDEVLHCFQPDLLIRFGQVPEEVEEDAVLLQDSGGPDRVFYGELHHLCRHQLSQILMLLLEKNVLLCVTNASGSQHPPFSSSNTFLVDER